MQDGVRRQVNEVAPIKEWNDPYAGGEDVVILVSRQHRLWYTAGHAELRLSEAGFRARFP